MICRTSWWEYITNLEMRDGTKQTFSIVWKGQHINSCGCATRLNGHVMLHQSFWCKSVLSSCIRASVLKATWIMKVCLRCMQFACLGEQEQRFKSTICGPNSLILLLEFNWTTRGETQPNSPTEPSLDVSQSQTHSRLFSPIHGRNEDPEID